MNPVLLLKVLLTFLIADKPFWVVKAEARSAFAKEEVRKRGSVHVMSSDESAAFQATKKSVFESICDDDGGASSTVTGSV